MNNFKGELLFSRTRYWIMGSMSNFVERVIAFGNQGIEWWADHSLTLGASRVKKDWTIWKNGIKRNVSETIGVKIGWPPFSSSSSYFSYTNRCLSKFWYTENLHWCYLKGGIREWQRFSRQETTTIRLKIGARFSSANSSVVDLYLAVSFLNYENREHVGDSQRGITVRDHNPAPFELASRNYPALLYFCNHKVLS